MPDVAFVNGAFVSLADAKVSIDDRGFQFGDGIYEVIRTYGGRPFELEAHLARLDRSAAALDLTQPYSLAEWTNHILEGIRRAAYPEAKIYIQLTRGVAPRDHAYEADLTPTVVLTVRELHSLSRSVQAAGVEAMTIEDIRWGRCDIKSLSLLGNVLARQQAKRAQVFEAILLKEGSITEGAVSNVMVVRGGTVMTAPEGPRILSGVTRAVVLGLARKEGLPVQERCIAQADLYGADEVFLTGTTVEVLAVVRVDGKVIKDGRPGPITQRLAAGFTGLVG
ncbi:MAG: D-amino-acid transaminase [Nitrospiraceae bacterium]|jgi:D-alanine transaminase|nr:D-amino-acid transaminase [Nitrospira sp.]MDW7649233.1 D-amino-acid transaminase [Nitrospiraceae bacterium]GDX89045.1 D-alanine aminotransferase [Nitrospirota bacterium]MBP0121949.1 D-amino-acid transaminase [Nitrospira sp.]MBP0124462.1 D-amino-acid transaminase [Nitrospira sp.]